MAAFLERLAGEPHVRLRYFCSPQHTDSALHPIIGHMARAAGFARNDDAKTKLDKLDALLVTSATSREDAALLAELLSLPDDGRYPAPDLAPQQRRQRTMEALIRQIEVISRQSPVLMIFEDAHWADPSSVELFGRLVDKIDGLPVLLFMTFRPEFAAPWIGRPHVTPLTINRLIPRQAMALIEQVAGNRPLAENIRRDIVDRTDGIPLFVEEMTKAVLEAEGEGAAARTLASIPSPVMAVPASLHASLMARLDRLGPAKGLAQISAAIGREFSHALLAAVARKPDAELGSALDRLINAGLLFRRHRQLNELGTVDGVSGGHVDCPRPSLSPPSLSAGSDQLCRLALFPVSPEPSHGRGDAGGARDLRDLRDRAPVGEEVRQGVLRSDPPARACSRRQMAYG